MPKLKDESFQAVSRGLLAHLCEMTGNQVKLYLYLLLRAKNKGPKKGTIQAYGSEICENLGWAPQEFYRTLKNMGKYLTVKFSGSRHNPILITINKFKTVPDFYLQHDVESNVDGSVDGNVDGSATVTPPKSTNNNDLKTPKKEKKVEEDKKEIYIKKFEEFWNVYPKRNGKRVGKKTTFLLFQKSPVEDLDLIIQNAKNYGIDNDLPKDPERFIKNDFWRDWDTPMTKEKDGASGWNKFEKGRDQRRTEPSVSGG